MITVAAAIPFPVRHSKISPPKSPGSILFSSVRRPCPTGILMEMALEGNRCRQCGQTYREEENSATACAYHTGWLMDYDKVGQRGPGLPGDFWDCCGETVEDATNVMGRTCAHGRHLPTAPPEPPPPTADLARQRVRRFLAGRIDPAYEKGGRDGLAGDVRVLEQRDPRWLMDRAGDTRFTVDLRRRLAHHIADAERAEAFRRAAV